MSSANLPLQARALMGQAFRDLLRPPLAVLLALTLLVTFVTSSLPSPFDGITTVGWIVLSVVNVYLQIAVVLAAAAISPARSADVWVKAAFEARCFWRSLLIELLTLLLVAAGLLLLVIGAFVIGAYLALAQPAVVLERESVIGALRRSVDLTADARVPIGVVYGLLVIIPSVALQAGAILLADTIGAPWIAANLVGVVLLTAGVVALARAFIALGGSTDNS